MKLHIKTVYWAVAGTVVICGIMVFIALQHEHRLRNSLESGQFESEYLSQIHQLQDEIEAVETQVSGNNPDTLTIPNKEYLETIRQQHPASEEIEQNTEPVLTGIYLNEQSPLAEINGVLLRTGEKVGRFKVGEISSYQVVLTTPEGERKILNLLE